MLNIKTMPSPLFGFEAELRAPKKRNFIAAGVVWGANELRKVLNKEERNQFNRVQDYKAEGDAIWTADRNFANHPVVQANLSDSTIRKEFTLYDIAKERNRLDQAKAHDNQSVSWAGAWLMAVLAGVSAWKAVKGVVKIRL